jgi:tetratricopeptide (TPR) repeat protein
MARRELALRIKALSVLLPLNRIDDGIANLGHAERLANLTGDHRRLAAMRVQLAVIQWTLGRYETGIESAHSAATAAILARDRNMEMAAAQARLMLLHAQGHYSEVVATARRISRRFATELARRELIPGWAIMASIGVRVFLADSLARLGNLSGAQRALDASYRELSHHQHAFSRVLTDFIQATHWMDLERFEEAAILLAAAAESCRTHDLTTMYPPVIAAMGGAMARAGRVEAGLALLEEAHRDGIHRQGGRYNEVYLPANLGIALSLAGRHTEALGFMQVALDSASTLGQAGHRADTLRLMGELRERAGDPEGAVASYQECRRAALACGMARVAADAARRLTGLRSNPPSRRGARHAEKA